MKQLDKVELFVCSEDGTSAIGFADKVEVWTEGGGATIILRGINGDREDLLQAENECLRRDVEFYKNLWQARGGGGARPAERQVEIEGNEMTKRYTAADFANARFAEHPGGNYALRKQLGGPKSWIRATGGFDMTDEELAECGWVPFIAARIIHDSDVEALCTDKASYERDDYLDGFIRGFQQAGGVILEDPEPTNTDRLRELHQAWINECGDLTLSEYFDKHGVTAPEGNA